MPGNHTNHHHEADMALKQVDEWLEMADDALEHKQATYTEQNYLTRAMISSQVATAHAILARDVNY